MQSSDPVAIVTGASSGVGAATTRTLASEGYAVVLAARRERRLEDVANDVATDAPGAEAIVVPTDLTDDALVDALVDAAVERFERLDVLVNNAGVLVSDPLVDADRGDLRRQIEVNLLGSMLATHAALPALRDGDGGHVVNVSSMNAQYPAAGAPAYTASKAGVNGFYDALRKDLGDEPVRVTTVMPGPIATEMADWSDWDGRELLPRDVADAIRYAVTRPPHVEIPDLTVNTTDKLA